MFFGSQAISIALSSGDSDPSEQLRVNRYWRNRAAGDEICPPRTLIGTLAHGLQLFSGLFRLPLRLSSVIDPPRALELRCTFPQYAKSFASSTSLTSVPESSRADPIE